jgi:hypothetical protein
VRGVLRNHSASPASAFDRNACLADSVARLPLGPSSEPALRLHAVRDPCGVALRVLRRRQSASHPRPSVLHGIPRRPDVTMEFRCFSARTCERFGDRNVIWRWLRGYVRRRGRDAFSPHSGTPVRVHAAMTIEFDAPDTTIRARVGLGYPRLDRAHLGYLQARTLAAWRRSTRPVEGWCYDRFAATRNRGASH